MNPDALSELAPLVLDYFRGERREMLSILGTSAIMAVAVVAFFKFSRDGFAKGLMITVLACAALLSATAISLLIRDTKLSQSIASGLSTSYATTIVQQEQSRLVAVIDNYPRYRWAAGAFGLAALSILALSRQPWSHGVAAGLLLLVVAQVIIDHYSERRARTYLDEIALVARKR
jgi:hypothetical protein